MSFDLQLQPPGPEAQAVALKELRETEENVKEGLASLKKYLKDHPVLVNCGGQQSMIYQKGVPEIANNFAILYDFTFKKLQDKADKDDTLYFKTDDDFLLIFLRPCKYYAKSAYELMKRVADFKEKHANLLDNLMPQDEKPAILSTRMVNVLKNRDHKGRRVLMLNIGKTWDPSKITTDQMLRVLYLIHDLAILEPETQIFGAVVIMDFDGLAMKQVMGFTPSFSMKLLGFIQEAMPLRLKEVHIVKQPFIFNMVWQMFKPFVKEKLKKRLFFHGSKMSSLHTHIPPSHLPKDYGGDLPMIDYGSADWYPTLEKHEDKIREWNTYGYRKKQ